MTDCSSYCLDVESFIRQVELYPEIWDKRCEESRHKLKKSNAWAKIASVFIKDFDELPNLDKLEVYRKLHNKWRNIRDTYVRTLKRDHQEGKKSYMYSDYLKFLNEIYKSQVSDLDEDEQSQWEPPPPAKRRKPARVAEVAEWQEIPGAGHRDSDVGIEFVESKEPSADEDRSFFESLLPVVREFDTDQKLDFRSQVLLLVKQIRSLNKREVIVKRRRPSESSD